MITLTFLGVGSAFAKRNYNSNMLLETWKDGKPDEVMLVDFGITGPMALHELSKQEGFEHLRAPNGALYGRSIPKIFVTHQHGDHAAGLEEMALTNFFVHRYRPKIYGAPEVLDTVWEHSLRAGCDTIPGKRANLDDFFEVCPESRSMTLGEYEIKMFRTDHIRIMERFDWPSYGFTIHKGDKSAYISGDSRLDFARIEAMSQADVVFHDCAMVDLKDFPHATLRDLSVLPSRIKKKMYLYHYGDNFDDEIASTGVGQFAGLAQQGRRYRLL